jgi:flagellar biosynthesis/type III secretory pathway protein FliH
VRAVEVNTVGHVIKGHVVPAVVMDARAQAAEIVAAAVAERERARASGFARGRDEGRAEAAAALVGMLAAARAEERAVRARVEPAAFAIAARMAEKIVGHAVALDPTIMATIAAEAVAACRTRGGVAQLRVHPDDLAPVMATRAALADALGGEDALEIVADESVGRHGCVVDTAVGRVDARLATQLEALRRVLSSPDTSPATSRGARG